MPYTMIPYSWLARLMFCLLLTLGAPAALSASGAPIVIVLSWDGLRHDYPDVTELPGLARLEREGVRARRLRAGWPSNTFPGHVNMATGTYADRHGIVDNRFRDRERGNYSYSADANWLQAEPLWIAAERQGRKAATYFWVGSETDWRGMSQSYRIAPFDGARPEELKVRQILAWLSLPATERPQLIMSYWAGVDSLGHDFGPDSRRLAAQLVDQDRHLANLMSGIDQLGLWPQTTLLLVSDHGMTKTTTRLDLTAGLAERGIEAAVFGGAVAQVFVDDPAQRPAAGAALRQILDRRCPDARVFPRGGLPADMRLNHPTRSGDWTVVAEPPCSFSSASGFAAQMQRLLGWLGWDFGSHGYDPDLPDMGGVFMAVGAGVEPGLELGEVRQIDVAATVAELLNIEPPASSEGRPLL